MDLQMSGKEPRGHSVGELPTACTASAKALRWGHSWRIEKQQGDLPGGVEKAGALEQSWPGEAGDVAGVGEDLGQRRYVLRFTLREVMVSLCHRGHCTE